MYLSGDLDKDNKKFDLNYDGNVDYFELDDEAYDKTLFSDKGLEWREICKNDEGLPNF